MARRNLRLAFTPRFRRVSLGAVLRRISAERFPKGVATRTFHPGTRAFAVVDFLQTVYSKAIAFDRNDRGFFMKANRDNINDGDDDVNANFYKNDRLLEN